MMRAVPAIFAPPSEADVLDPEEVLDDVVDPDREVPVCELPALLMTAAVDDDACVAAEDATEDEAVLRDAEAGPEDAVAVDDDGVAVDDVPRLSPGDGPAGDDEHAASAAAATGPRNLRAQTIMDAEAARGGSGSRAATALPARLTIP
jgi:hypothetical protein